MYFYTNEELNNMLEAEGYKGDLDETEEEQGLYENTPLRELISSGAEIIWDL